MAAERGPLAGRLPRWHLCRPQPRADVSITPPRAFLSRAACTLRAAPRLLAFAPDEQLAPAVAYLQGCGLGRPALLGLLRAQPALALAAVEHKVRTDRAAAALRAAYQLQSEERTAWAVDAAAAARRGLSQRGW